MAFTTDIKDEICGLKKNNIENISELSAFVRNNGIIKENRLVITTENSKVARRVYSLFKEIYDISCNVETIKKTNLNKKRCYTITIDDNAKEVLKKLNIESLSAPVENYLIDSEEEKRAYLRGVFLATGSINNPQTSSYHLEMFIKAKKEAEKIIEILKYFYIDGKILKRSKEYMIYVKKSEKIADFLRVIEANRAVLFFEDIRIYRDHKNMTNRLNNCEQANVEKILKSCNKQIEDIEKILKVYPENAIDEKLKIIMDYRLKYKDVSLTELSNIIYQETGEEITKSGINHRFRKIKEIAEKIK